MRGKDRYMFLCPVLCIEYSSGKDIEKRHGEEIRKKKMIKEKKKDIRVGGGEHVLGKKG